MRIFSGIYEVNYENGTTDRLEAMSFSHAVDICASVSEIDHIKIISESWLDFIDRVSDMLEETTKSIRKAFKF